MGTIWEKITADTKLISLPEIYLQLKSVLDDPDYCMADVATLIINDPGITTRLLRLVNSPYFGLAAKVGTVSRAISMLGTQQVHDLVLATSVTQTFGAMSNQVMDMHRYWWRSVYCGVVSRLLANECNVLDSERLFVAGLLRDIGHLIMYQSIPDLSQQAIDAAAASGRPLFEVERELIGLDYARVGGTLMRQWDLPKSLQESTQFHIQPAKANDYYSLETGIIHLSALMAESADSEAVPDEWQSRVDVAAWHATDLSLEQCTSVQAEAEGQIKQVFELIMPQQRQALG